jgi:transcriptional regulator with XRE-family HTH domain
MTGLELKTWRLGHNLTLRDVSELLEREVTHVSLSRWENSPNPIPKWAEEKLYLNTKITLPLEDFEDLMAIARNDDIPFNELLAMCIHEHMQRRRGAMRGEGTPPKPINYLTQQSPDTETLRVADSAQNPKKTRKE